LSSILLERLTIKDGVVEQSELPRLQRDAHVGTCRRRSTSGFVEVDTRPTGLGEIGNPFIAGAISNAFYRLTGKRMRHLPFHAGARTRNAQDVRL